MGLYRWQIDFIWFLFYFKNYWSLKYLWTIPRPEFISYFFVIWMDIVHNEPQSASQNMTFVSVLPYYFWPTLYNNLYFKTFGKSIIDYHPKCTTWNLYNFQTWRLNKIFHRISNRFFRLKNKIKAWQKQTHWTQEVQQNLIGKELITVLFRVRDVSL